MWDALDGVANVFPEIDEAAAHCKFRDCSHTHEPGCAVLEAVRSGELSPARVERYHLLLKKAQEAWRNRYD